MADLRQTIQEHVLVEYVSNSPIVTQEHILVEYVSHNREDVQEHVLVEARVPMRKYIQEHILVENRTDDRILIQEHIFMEARYIEIPPLPCYVTEVLPQSIASEYFVEICDTSGNTVALLDNWISFEYSKVVDDVGYYVLTLNGNDPRIPLFTLDCKVRLWRRAKGCGMNWYVEFVGLHRTPEYVMETNELDAFVSSGVGFNDLLARTAIAYKKGFVQSDKSAAAEAVMKAFVNENCGLLATVANGRLYDGVLPGFSVQPVSAVPAGAVWSGVAGGDMLLPVLKDISKFSGVDFNVIDAGKGLYEFRTYPDQLGADRTNTGLNTATGLNASGNRPVVFSQLFGNVQSIRYRDDHAVEVNTVFAWGQGEKSTQDVFYAVDAVSRALSPLNRCEGHVSATNQEYDYQVQAAADEGVEKSKAVETYEFVPLFQYSCIYGLHYFHGDRVTVEHKNIKRDKRLTEVKNMIADKKDNWQFTFVDVTR